MKAKQWLVTLAWSLLIALILLYLATYFDVPFVREAGGRQATAVHDDRTTRLHTLTSAPPPGLLRPS